MCAATGTYDLGAHHAVTHIAMLAYSIASERRPETRPAGPRVVLRIGMKERLPTTDASVDTVIFVIRVRTRESTLGPLVSGDLIRKRREPLSQFLIARDVLAHTL